MFRRKYLGICLSASLIVFHNCTAWSQDNWGTKMFDRAEVDFGAVAKGTEAKERIKVRNLYREAIQITPSTSCVCFKAEVANGLTTIPSGETAEIELTVNTVNYERKRDATLTVRLLEPTRGSTAEVRVPLKAYIRVDVVCTPGVVQFGTVDLGAGAEQSVKIAYAGRPDWQIREVKSTNPQLITDIKEVSRANGLVNYELKVAMKPQSTVGPIRDQIMLITNDVANQQVPLFVRGDVEADVVVTPVLDFGMRTPGESKTMTLVVRARKPIVIEKIEREKEDKSFSVRLPADARPVHALPITFVPPSDLGDFNEVFTITIAGRHDPVTFRAQGKITAAAGSTPN